MRQEVIYAALFLLAVLMAGQSSALYTIEPSCGNVCIANLPSKYNVTFTHNTPTAYYLVTLTDNVTGKVVASSGDIELIVEQQESILIDGFFPEPGNYLLVPCFKFAPLDEQLQPKTAQLSLCGEHVQLLKTISLEDAECRVDSECSPTQKCTNFACENIVCTDCQYIQDQQCLTYQCCDNSFCSKDELCTNHKCEKVSCAENQQVVNHSCEDCEGDQSSLDQKCVRLDCKDNEKAENHECTALKCALFMKAVDHECSVNSRFIYRILLSLAIIALIGLVFYHYWNRQQE